MDSWSFSRYSVWSKCPYRAKLQYVDRKPLPPKPQADRGVSLHDNAQNWVKGETEELHADLDSFANELRALKNLYAQGKVEIEEPWGFTRGFEQYAEWREAWCRIKLDFHVKVDDKKTLVVDYKSGKKDGNQIKHTEQGQLYAVGSYLKNPAVEEVDVEFWYGDQNESQRNSYSADQIQQLIVKWRDIGDQVTSGKYPPRPNIFSCRYCPYRLEEDGGSGACSHAVKLTKSTRKKSSAFFDFGR